MAIPEKRWLALLDWQRLHLAVACWPREQAQIAADSDAGELHLAVLAVVAASLAGHAAKPPPAGFGQKRTFYVQTG